MNKEDKKLQKHLVDEMMKVYETNPNVMLYMQSLMENYEKLEQENKQLKEELESLKDAFDFNLGAIENIRKENHKLEDKIDKAIEYIKTDAFWVSQLEAEQKLLSILGDKE